jgi:hypothetical protein
MAHCGRERKEANMTQQILIKIIEHPMTDGSKVHNVVVIDTEDKSVMDFPAMTEKSAADFAVGLQALICNNTLCFAQLA